CLSGPEVVTALAECLVAHMTVPSIAGDAGGTGGGQRSHGYAGSSPCVKEENVTNIVGDCKRMGRGRPKGEGERAARADAAHGKAWKKGGPGHLLRQHHKRKNPLISQRAIFSVAERKRFELLVRF
ncbi:hypothetical protein, partial [Desulfovibrio sp.]|uniref:hypothetical protein n=1 Tax=Desulfovibrio sp. TaxID=885 RepID=UPI002A75ECCB